MHEPALGVGKKGISRGQLRVTNGPRGHVSGTSVDPPIPDEIAAARKSAVPCHLLTSTSRHVKSKAHTKA
jgi:hypothetical protein